MFISVHLSGLDSGSPYFSHGAVIAEARELTVGA
jgi:hypothetical protein